MVRLIVEAIAVGLGIVVVGTLVSWVVGRMMGTDLPPVCKDWNKNYIMENNKDLPVNIVREKFIKSTAAFSVITYLLGIGDRHLDNIMVTKAGILFHIDFSFCIGHDPKPFYPSIRITKEMIDMIGGEDSSNYKYFIEQCNIYYNSIRKYT